MSPFSLKNLYVTFSSTLQIFVCHCVLLLQVWIYTIDKDSVELLLKVRNDYNRMVLMLGSS